MLASAQSPVYPGPEEIEAVVGPDEAEVYVGGEYLTTLPSRWWAELEKYNESAEEAFVEALHQQVERDGGV